MDSRQRLRLAFGLAAAGALPVFAKTTSTVQPSADTTGPGGYPVAPINTGKGSGVFSAHSSFKPLASRNDVLSWDQLAAITTKLEGQKIVPQFTLIQTKFDKKAQRLQGYIMPLHAGLNHKHFLLTSVPMTCAFCVPGGPESMVEVRSKSPITYTMEPIVLQGRFALLPNNEHGLYYSLSDAVLFS
jgi:uncharacterized protein